MHIFKRTKDSSMQVQKLKDDYFCLVLEKGEWIHSSLEQFAKEYPNTSFTLSGIGAVNQVDLSYFDAHKQEYLTKSFDQEYELLSCEGNLTYCEERPFAHLHVSLSASDFSVIGGHLNQAQICVTGEFFLQAHESLLERKKGTPLSFIYPKEALK